MPQILSGRDLVMGDSIRLGRYQVDQLLGQGGMGAVYLAHDPSLGRPVAVKVIHPRQATPESKERFLREARAVARLSHPNVVRVYDIGVEADGPREIHYIVMEFVGGRPLSHVIEGQGRPDLPEIQRRMRLFGQLVTAVGFAHSQGVVHRDLKPDNIMVGDDGLLKIMDFGLALLDAKHTQTRAGQMMGTLAYLAPEQAQGCPDLDHRCDIYALGMILFELCTGELPFEADNPLHFLQQILKEAPPLASARNPAVPAGLAMAIAMALQKEPLLRPPTCEALVARLEAWSSGPVPVVTAPPVVTPPAPATAVSLAAVPGGWLFLPVRLTLAGSRLGEQEVLELMGEVNAIFKPAQVALEAHQISTTGPSRGDFRACLLGQPGVHPLHLYLACMPTGQTNCPNCLIWPDGWRSHPARACAGELARALGLEPLAGGSVDRLMTPNGTGSALTDPECQQLRQAALAHQAVRE
jgi:predicted Ser/Thr protein kinase